MSRDWVRLGQALRKARKQLHMTQDELADAIGLNDSTIQNLETARHGKGFSRMPGSASAVAAYLGWTSGSVDAVLAGGEPALADNDEPESDPADSPIADLPWRVRQALVEGELLDTAVLEFPESTGGRMIVVVRGEPDVSPEQMQKNIEAWTRREDALRAVEDDDNGEEPVA